MESLGFDNFVRYSLLYTCTSMMPDGFFADFPKTPRTKRHIYSGTSRTIAHNGCLLSSGCHKFRSMTFSVSKGVDLKVKFAARSVVHTCSVSLAIVVKYWLKYTNSG